LNSARLSLDAVVFDFDGTLAKLNIDFLQMRKAVIRLIDSFGLSTDSIKDLFVLEMIEAGRILMSQNNPDQESFYRRQATDLVEQIEIEAAKKGNLLDGTREMLHELKSRKIKTGVVTRNCQSAVEHIFPDILTYFNSVLTRDHTPLVKPHPEHLWLTLQALQSAPECTSMVGDHPMDIKIGHDVGVLTIGVLTGASSLKDLVNAKADLILERAPDILDIIS
jgi:phosphoglycolate phosphatase